MTKDGVVLLAQGTPSLIEQLRKAADEIARDGHDGWGNLCQVAADELSALSAQVVELQQENKRYEENYAYDCVVMTRYVPAFGRLSDAINQLGQLVHSSVTRASVPPSVSDGGTQESTK